MVYGIENAKEEFLKIAKENIKRKGIDELLEYLEKTDFFTAPASTKFHSAYESGLCEHSIKVFNRFVKKLAFEYGENFEEVISLESAAIIALFHDICKVDTYVVQTRNVKEDGVWVQKPFYAFADKMPYGHGEKSVYMLCGFMKISREEAMAINWHMGEYDLRAKGGYSLSDVYYKHPIAFIFHIADNETTYLDEQC